MEEILTTGDAGEYLELSPASVAKLVDSGKIKGYSIPGSNHRKIPARSILNFLIKQGLLINGVPEEGFSSDRETADFLEGLVERDLLASGFNGLDAKQIVETLPFGNFLRTGQVAKYLTMATRSVSVQFDNENLRGYVVPHLDSNPSDEGEKDSSSDGENRRVLISSVFDFLNTNGYKTTVLPFNGFLTAGETAEILRVVNRTVAKKFDNGELRGYTIPSFGKSAQEDDDGTSKDHRRISRTSVIEYATSTPTSKPTSYVMYEFISPRILEKYRLPVLYETQTKKDSHRAA